MGRRYRRKAEPKMPESPDVVNARWVDAMFRATEKWHDSLQDCPLCGQAKLVPLRDGRKACCLRACKNFIE